MSDDDLDALLDDVADEMVMDAPARGSTSTSSKAAKPPSSPDVDLLDEAADDILSEVLQSSPPPKKPKETPGVKSSLVASRVS